MQVKYVRVLPGNAFSNESFVCQQRATVGAKINPRFYVVVLPDIYTCTWSTVLLISCGESWATHRRLGRTVTTVVTQRWRVHSVAMRRRCGSRIFGLSYYYPASHHNRGTENIVRLKNAKYCLFVGRKSCAPVDNWLMTRCRYIVGDLHFVVNIFAIQEFPELLSNNMLSTTMRTLSAEYGVNIRHKATTVLKRTPAPFLSLSVEEIFKFCFA